MQSNTQRINEILFIIKLRVDECKKMGGVSTRTALKIVKKALPELIAELEAIVAADFIKL